MQHQHQNNGKKIILVIGKLGDKITSVLTKDYQVYFSKDCGGALQCITKETIIPNLIIIDSNLRGMSIEEFITRFKKTATSSMIMAIKGNNLDDLPIDEIVEKSIDPQKFLKKIRFLAHYDSRCLKPRISRESLLSPGQVIICSN